MTFETHTLQINPNTQLEIYSDTWTLRSGTKEETFFSSKVWIDGTPAKDLEGARFRALKTEMAWRAEVIDDNLHLSFLPKWTLFIQHSGGTETLLVSPQLKGSDFHTLIAEKLNRSDFEISLSEDSTLHDSDTLQGSGIKEGMYLKIVSKCDEEDEVDETTSLRGTFFELGIADIRHVNFVFRHDQYFDNSAPEWRIVDSGLNLFGECRKEGCQAEGERAISPQSFGVWSMHEACSTAKCPMGNHYLKNVTNCYFYDCFYEIDGLTQSNWRIQVPKTKTQPNAATTFLETMKGQSQLEMWKHLEIKVSKSYSCTLV